MHVCCKRRTCGGATTQPSKSANIDACTRARAWPTNTTRTPHTKQTIAPHKLTPTMQQPQHSTAPRDAASHAHVRLPHTAQPRHHTDAAQQTSRQCTKRAKHSAAKPSEANRKRKLAFDGDIIDLLALADASAQFEQQLQDIETATSISIMYVC